MLFEFDQRQFAEFRLALQRNVKGKVKREGEAAPENKEKHQIALSKIVQEFPLEEEERAEILTDIANTLYDDTPESNFRMILSAETSAPIEEKVAMFGEYGSGNLFLPKPVLAANYVLNIDKPYPGMPLEIRSHFVASYKTFLKIFGGSPKISEIEQRLAYSQEELEPRIHYSDSTMIFFGLGDEAPKYAVIKQKEALALIMGGQGVHTPKTEKVSDVLSLVEENLGVASVVFTPSKNLRDKTDDKPYIEVPLTPVN